MGLIPLVPTGYGIAHFYVNVYGNTRWHLLGGLGMELLAILWVACGVISMVLAAKKERNGCGWFFIGVLLGPIGIVMSVVAPDKIPTRSRRVLTATNRSRREQYGASTVVLALSTLVETL